MEKTDTNKQIMVVDNQFALGKINFLLIKQLMMGAIIKI